MLVQKSVTKTIRDAKRKLERKIAKNMKKNPRQFYSYLSKNTKSRSPVGPLIDSDGTQVSEPQGMCQILNNFFSSVFTNEDITNAPVATSLTQSTVESMTATEEIFKKKLSKIKSNAAPGPDGITAWLLPKLQDVLAKPICMIYNTSLSSGEVPSDWKCAHVTPVFKKGNRSMAENYRPISLTSIVCKIFESMLCNVITMHLNKHNLLKSSQHGFVQNRSCLTNLLEYLETLTDLIDQGHCVDVFYLDFSKAFDRVPHQRLL